MKNRLDSVLVLCLGILLLAIPALTNGEETLLIGEKWTGDLDEMVKRRHIRVLVSYSKTFYFLDGADQRGISYDILKEFEQYINRKLKTRSLKVNVIIIPVPRDKLLPGLVEGRGDIAVANLTITPARLEAVDFSDPFVTDIDEVVVTGRGGPELVGLDDLAGKSVHVRKSSSYYENLARLNKSFKKAGKPTMKLIPADPFLEDEDLLEMVHAGLIPMVIVDSHKAAFWAQIFERITVHNDLAVNTGGQIAWAFRKRSPELQALINEFVRGHKKGTLLGNILSKRYLHDTKWVKRALAEGEQKKFRDTVDLFKKYADRYTFDYLMITALAYQESGLDHSKRSPRGAVGIMQVLPSTAADPNVDIANIDHLEQNIHAGVKYLQFIRERYFEKEEMNRLNKTLFTFASYNAGPARIAGLRKEAVKSGLDPNQWFGNVENIAAREIGRETAQYVSNVYKYYIAYRLVEDKKAVKEKKKKLLKGQ
jgi:membrane-bound lytic murein transglycosylase MltF